jgi:bifunctional non-homologous end joining protein LigD
VHIVNAKKNKILFNKLFYINTVIYNCDGDILMLEYPTIRAKKRFKCDTGHCIKPMLADAKKERLQKHNTRYILQEKYDGTRGILYKRKGVVTGLISRYCDNDFKDRFPDIVHEARLIKSQNCVIDGEITFFNKQGHPFFLTAAATPSTKKDYEVRYMVFDVLEYNGENVTKLPLLKRLTILRNIIPPTLEHIKIVKTYDNRKEFPKIYKSIVARKGEGVMLKRKTSEYVHDSRKFWTKVKKEQTEDCVVVGITEGLGRRKWTFGALVLGQYHNGKLVYVGNVGSGLDDDMLIEFYRIIMGMKCAENPFGVNVGHVKKFIKPVIVIEVKAMERNKSYTLRLPVFLRVRTDKTPKDCTF